MTMNSYTDSMYLVWQRLQMVTKISSIQSSKSNFNGTHKVGTRLGCHGNQTTLPCTTTRTATTTSKEFYIPHKHVVKQSAETTKLRIVYDASAKPTKAGLSLNECLEVGPALQNTLWNVLTRCRLKPVTGDSGIAISTSNVWTFTVTICTWRYHKTSFEAVRKRST